MSVGSLFERRELTALGPSVVSKSYIPSAQHGYANYHLGQMIPSGTENWSNHKS